MNEERLFSIILEPHVTEKSSIMAERHRNIAFKVSNDAKKPEIKTAVEKLFKVVVEKVCVLKVKGKTRRFKGTFGKTKQWKKALVRLQEGDDINFADFE